MSKIRKCPFCGGEDIEIKKEYALGGYWFFGFCDTCNAISMSARTIKDAIAEWNERADDFTIEELDLMRKVLSAIPLNNARLTLLTKISNMINERSE